MSELIIKKGNLEILRIPKEQIATVSGTGDGLVFNLKHDFYITYTDSYMPAGTKDIISNTINNFANANLTVDVLNYRRPIIANIV
jgi:hypothetical protein